MSKKVAAFEAQFGMKIGSTVLVHVNGDDAIAVLVDAQIDSDNLPCATFALLDGSSLVDMIGETDIRVRMSTNIADGRSRLIESARKILKDRARALGLKVGQKIDGNKVVAFLDGSLDDASIRAVVRDGNGVVTIMNLPSQKQKPSKKDDSVQADKKAIRKFEKAGFQVNGAALLATHASGALRIDSITEAGARLVSLDGQETVFENVQVSDLIDMHAEQKTSRGTPWKPVDVLAARYGFLIGDEVTGPMGISGKITSAVYNTFPGNTVGDVRALVTNASSVNSVAPASLSLVGGQREDEGIAVGAAVMHAVNGLGLVIEYDSAYDGENGDRRLLVQFQNGEIERVSEVALEVRKGNKVKFSEIGLLQAFKVGDQAFVKVGGSTAIAAPVFGPSNQPHVELAICSVDLGKNAKRSFKQSDKVSFYHNT